MNPTGLHALFLNVADVQHDVVHPDRGYVLLAHGILSLFWRRCDIAAPDHASYRPLWLRIRFCRGQSLVLPFVGPEPFGDIAT